MIFPTYRRIYTALLCFLAATFLTACASQQVASTQAIKQKAAKHAEKRVLTPQEAIDLAEAELAEVDKENLDFFSPLHLAQAKQSLAQAKEFARKPVAGQPNGAIEYALSAREFIKKGLSNKADVLIYIKEAIAHKRMLQKLEAPSLYPERYQTVLFEFSKLIKLIEEGEPNQALNRQGTLRDKMYALEIDTLIHIHLSEAIQIINEAEANDAERYAPTSFYNAQHKIASTENYIRTNYRDRMGIKKSGEHALLLAKRAHEVGIASKKLMTLDSAGSEQYVLSEIKRLQGYFTQLGNGDLPPQSIERSAIDVKIAIQDFQKQVQSIEKKLASVSAELKRYTEVTTTALDDSSVSDVMVLKTLNKKEISDEPVLNEDEQGFDNIEFVE